MFFFGERGFDCLLCCLFFVLGEGIRLFMIRSFEVKGILLFMISFVFRKWDSIVCPSVCFLLCVKRIRLFVLSFLPSGIGFVFGI